ncbi:MAG: CinA family protein, partial [Actinobacteria bacterium]|nr:CinA family protein [Actinomycetota bacterium]
ELLGLADGPVVSEAAALAMAESARNLLGADVGLSITGVAGPDTQDGQVVGTVFVAVVTPDSSEVTSLLLPGDRDRIRQYAAISALDLLRRKLQA